MFRAHIHSDRARDLAFVDFSKTDRKIIANPVLIIIAVMTCHIPAIAIDFALAKRCQLDSELVRYSGATFRDDLIIAEPATFVAQRRPRSRHATSRQSLARSRVVFASPASVCKRVSAE